MNLLIKYSMYHTLFDLNRFLVTVNHQLLDHLSLLSPFSQHTLVIFPNLGIQLHVQVADN